MLDNSKSDTLEILIATMNQTSLSFLDKMFGELNWTLMNIFVVNQTTPENILNSDFKNIRVLNSFETGLSKSRNLAIQNAKADIVLIADDDVVFMNDFEKTIKNAYLENPNAAMIAFAFANEKGQLYKEYPKNVKTDLNHLDLYNIMSVEITFKRAGIVKQQVQFDENFGLGSVFPISEEAIFLFDLKKQNIQLICVPEVIASHDSISTVDKIEIKKYYYNLGAVYSRIHGRLFFIWVFLKIAFDLKQSRISLNQITSVIKAAVNGRNYYLKLMVNRN